MLLYDCISIGYEVVLFVSADESEQYSKTRKIAIFIENYNPILLYFYVFIIFVIINLQLWEV